MKNTIVIRQINSQETHHIRKIVLRPNHDEKSVIFPGDDLEDTVHFGLFVEEDLVCIASLYKEPLKGSNDLNGWQLRAMATLPGFQGKGCGSKLLEFCIKLVKEKAGSYIWCNARINTVSYYKKFGFEVIGEEFEISGIGKHIIMVLKLETP